MTEPAILVLDDVPEELEELRGALRRYGLEYLVICESSAAAASDRLARLATDGRPLAIVCAPVAMIEAGRGEFLAVAHRLYPAAKRVLIVPRGGPSAPSLRVPAALLHDESVAQSVLRAITLGVVDTSCHRLTDPGTRGFISLLANCLKSGPATAPRAGQRCTSLAGSNRPARTNCGTF